MYEVTCLDLDGNELTSLTQWDINQMLIIKDSNFEQAPVFHFCNKNSEHALSVQSVMNSDGIIKVDIPNILLTESHTIIVYAYLCNGVNNEEKASGKTVDIIRIPVKEKIKPDDFLYIDNIDVVYIRDLVDEVQQFHDEVNEAEIIRVTNENQRITNELERIANENQRDIAIAEIIQSCENKIQECEDTVLETLEVKNEVQQFHDEVNEAEIIRVTNENQRITNELERIANENQRILNENQRDIAIAEAKASGDNAQSDVDVLSAKIGVIPNNKTIIELIAESQTSATYDDTIIVNRVENIENSIDILNGNGDGSINKIINSAITQLVNGADESFDTLKEIADWILNGNTSTAGVVNDLNNLKTLVGSTAVSTQISNALTSALKINGVDKYALATDLLTITERLNYEFIQLDIVITTESWTENNGYFSVDISIENCDDSKYPMIFLHKESLLIAYNAGLYSSAQSFDGFVRLWSNNRPLEQLNATVVLL